MKLAIIGGSGLYALNLGVSSSTHRCETPFSTEAVTVTEEQVGTASVLFLPRHGASHSLPPHLINYRANLWALRELGATHVIAVNAVGGISPGMTTGRLVLPEQLIDYTWGREHTYATVGGLTRHVDFTVPYDLALRMALFNAIKTLGAEPHMGGVYGCTQGPRLESAAEIKRLRLDGCDIVGMTGMPEAGLARELGLPYACLALVVNRAAGLGGGPITAEELMAALNAGVDLLRQVLARTIKGLY